MCLSMSDVSEFNFHLFVPFNTCRMFARIYLSLCYACRPHDPTSPCFWLYAQAKLFFCCCWRFLLFLLWFLFRLHVVLLLLIHQDRKLNSFVDCELPNSQHQHHAWRAKKLMHTYNKNDVYSFYWKHCENENGKIC